MAESNDESGIQGGCEQEEEEEPVYGVIANCNGVETMISETAIIKSGDIVGVRLNRLTGEIAFDINGDDLGVVFQDERLKTIEVYPTFGLGLKGDVAAAVEPAVQLKLIEKLDLMMESARTKVLRALK